MESKVYAFRLTLVWYQKYMHTTFETDIFFQQALRNSCELLRQRIERNCMQALVTASKLM